MKKIANVLGGEEAVTVVMALNKLGQATDDELLNETCIKLNDIRKALNKLYNHSIVQCDRLRDEQTGWFIFRWRIQSDQFEGFIKNQKRKILRIFNKRLDYEKNNEFFYCGTPGDRRMTFEEAMEMIFRCPNCGKKLDSYDNKDIIKALSDKIEELKKEAPE
ncbi:transcription factor [Candidatus Bathyarchaeota archaeon]|nr:transcription factor [Candidatus Bathyarchaeota archaeon]